ncbi:MAG: 4-carboxymuconolactone decarboxylase [Actinomycetota bacterium]|nr:4-carboxymuconolactone decarboxylase [Actinomycetota bacterium]
MDDDDRRAQGFHVRRQVLGDDHVDAAVAQTSPLTADFQDYLTRTAWGEIWSRPGLDHHARSLLTIALLTALGHEIELAMHIRAAVRRNGVTPAQVAEAILHASLYAGVPAANRALAVAQRELAALGYAEAEPEKGPAT